MESVIYERDPGKRSQIHEYPSSKRDEVRRFYINVGSFQPQLDEYPLVGSGSHRRRFQYHYFTTFPWLEFSPTTQRAYCFPYFPFSQKPQGKSGSDTFTIKGFQSWWKVHNGKDCAFLTHMGKDTNSAHNCAMRCYESLKNSMSHIEKVIEKQNAKVMVEARLRLKASIDAIRRLTFQACAFRGHDKSPESKNQGNFLEMIKILTSYNKEVKGFVSENAPGNAKYTSPIVHKEILYVFAQKVHTTIQDEIGNIKFC